MQKHFGMCCNFGCEYKNANLSQYDYIKYDK